MNSQLKLLFRFFFQSRILPCNAQSIRRAWEQSSFRTPRTDKHAFSSKKKLQLKNPQVRRSLSMIAVDDEIFDKEKSKATVDNGKTTTSTTTTNDSSKPNSIFSSRIPLATRAKTHSSSGVTSWGISFEHLLSDAAALATFAEFLKQEYSAENIYFWTACERFRLLEDQAERAVQAKLIFKKHLANGSLEPVNVDSKARSLNQEVLQQADKSIFALAQKQIFNLMKFDSYQRFIRSDLYKRCLEAELKSQPLPFPADSLDNLLKTNATQNASPKVSILNNI